MNQVLKKSTVLDSLRYLNSAKARRANHATYMDLLLPYDSDAPYGHTDLVTNWYKRNLRIFTNINRLNNLSSDRLLLIIGAGHLAILSDFAREASYFCPVDPLDYLR